MTVKAKSLTKNPAPKAREVDYVCPHTGHTVYVAHGHITIQAHGHTTRLSIAQWAKLGRIALQVGEFFDL
jgi:hypothetical protein